MNEVTYEKSRRSLVKTVTFRVTKILLDTVIAFSIIQKAEIALSFVVFTNLAGMLLYYGHERFWNNVSWGRASKKLPDHPTMPVT